MHHMSRRSHTGRRSHSISRGGAVRSSSAPRRLSTDARRERQKQQQQQQQQQYRQRSLSPSASEARYRTDYATQPFVHTAPPPHTPELRQQYRPRSVQSTDSVEESVGFGGGGGSNSWAPGQHPYLHGAPFHAAHVKMSPLQQFLNDNSMDVDTDIDGLQGLHSVRVRECMLCDQISCSCAVTCE